MDTNYTDMTLAEIAQAINEGHDIGLRATLNGNPVDIYATVVDGRLTLSATRNTNPAVELNDTIDDIYINESDAKRLVLVKLAKELLRRMVHDYNTALEERDEARYNARILAHAYVNDNRPPNNVVKQSLAYGVDQRHPKSSPTG